MQQKEPGTDPRMLFASKSDGQGCWECIPQHLCDTAYVMERLCDPKKGWVTPAFIKAAGMEPELFRKVCVFAAAVHDIGQYSPLFQNKIAADLPGLSERLRENGFDTGRLTVREKPRHAFISGAILHELYGADPAICDVVASHHGVPRAMDRRSEWSYPFRHYRADILGENDEYTALYEESIKDAEEISGIRCRDIPALSVQAQILMSGLLIIAEWASSNADVFPLSTMWDTDMAGDTERRERGWELLSVKRGIRPLFPGPEVLGQWTGHTGSPLAEKAVRSAKGAKLMLIEAADGTERMDAALSAASIMACETGSDGLYIGYPSQITADHNFHKILEWAGSALKGRECSATLADDLDFAFSGSGDNTSGLREAIRESGLVMNGWTGKRYMELMPDIVCGTVERACGMTLGARFFMLVHAQMAGKAVIIDTGNGSLLASPYIKAALSYFRFYHNPVVILAPVLPLETKRGLLAAYAGGTTEDIYGSAGYPCVTVSDGTSAKSFSVEHGPGEGETKVAPVHEEDLLSRIGPLLHEGRRICVIRNTVDDAVRTYKEIKKNMPCAKVLLYHTRFLIEKRKEIEKEILEYAGSKKKDAPVIVVASHEIEDIPDLHFESVFFDPCPIDVLLARTAAARNTSGERACDFYLLMGKEKKENVLPSYDSYIVTRTLNVLAASDWTIKVPGGVRPITDLVYDKEEIKSTAAGREYLRRETERKMRAEKDRLPGPSACDGLRGMAQRWDVTGKKNGPSMGTGKLMPVVMLMYRDGYVMDIGERKKYRVDGAMPCDIDFFLKQVVTVPSEYISAPDIEKMRSAAGLDAAPWLAGKNVFILNERLRAGGHEMDCEYEYDRETGLMVKRI